MVGGIRPRVWQDQQDKFNCKDEESEQVGVATNAPTKMTFGDGISESIANSGAGSTTWGVWSECSKSGL